MALLTGASPADAQSESEIVLDDNSLERAPLGQPQAVGDGFLWRITEQQGTPSGENLFFGFKFFSVGANDTALFTSDGAESVEMIKRIIARVTGNSRSEILGKLSVDSVFSNFEDLFLLNPAGILFGPRSSLDIPGSAFFSSADELRFGGTDTIVFPTGSDERPTVLATAAPTEFGFIGDEARDARPIELDLWDESGGVGTTLFLAEGTRLTLVGEGVDIHRNPSSVGDAIDARSSTVAIASVGSGDVTVPVDVTSPDFQPKAMASESLGPVTIGNGARIVADSSFVLVSRPTGRVVIRAGSFALGSFPTQDGSEPTAGGELVMENVAGPSAPEAAVDIETTETLEIRDGSAVRVVSGKGQAGGSAGEIRLAGGEVVVQGPGTRVLNEAFFASGTETRLEGGTVRVADGAEVGSDATLLGKGGDIVVRGESLAVAGGSIVAQTTLLGEGGNVDVDVSGDVSVTRSDSPVEGFDARPVGRIAAQATAGATMPAGNVQIRAASISVESAAPDEGRVDDLGVPSQIASLTQAANAGATGGDVRLEALTLNLTGGGQLLAITTNGATGGNIEVDAASITIDGAPTDGEALEAGSPTSQIAAITRGASEAASGGDVAIVTESLRLTGGGEVLALTTGEADAGTITVNGGLASDGLTPVTARLVEVSGQLDDPTGGPPVPSGIFADAQTGSSGSAGKVDVLAEQILVSDGGAISARSEEGSTGRPGDVELRGDLLRVTDGGGLSVESGDAADEPGGELLIVVDRAEFLSGGFASAGTLGVGDAGTVDLSAREIEIAGQGSGLTARPLVDDVATGDGGNLIVRVGETLVIRDGGQISSDQGGDSEGLPGNIEISGTGAAPRLEMSNGAKIDTSVVNPDDEGEAPSEILIKDLESVSLASGSAITAETTGRGQGGNIRVENVAQLRLSSGAEISSSTESTGPGGSIAVTTGDSVILESGARITAESTSSAEAAGPAGEIQIDAGRELRLRGDSTIETRTQQAAGGRIRLSASDLVYLEDSLVETSVRTGGGNGGDIGIPLFPEADSIEDAAEPSDAPEPALLAMNRSFIRANAVDGDGGNIEITANRVLLSDSSAITASSERGVDGEIKVDSAESDLAGQLVPLSMDFFDASQLMMPPCAARTSRSGSFVIQYRAIPAAPPDGPLSLALLTAPEGQQCVF